MQQILHHGIAGEDLTALRGYGVRLDTTSTPPKIVRTGVLRSTMIGVLLNEPAAGERAEVGLVGVFPVISSAAIAADDVIMAATSGGKFLTSTTSTDRVIGRAIQAASAGDQLILAFFGCGVSTSRG